MNLTTALQNIAPWVPPAPDPIGNGPTYAPVGDYYASPTGTSGGVGTQLDPWDLQTALQKTSQVVAGKVLLVMPGTYVGKFRSTLTGGIVKAIDAKIDGYAHSTLSNPMAAGNPAAQNYPHENITFAVADASVFKRSYDYGAADGVVIDGEVFHFISITGNNITATRAASSSIDITKGIAHAQGATVVLVGSQFEVDGSNTTYWGLEITNTDTRRNWQVDMGEGLRGNGVFNKGDHNKFINVIAHDNLTGFFNHSNSSNTEFSGCLSYNNGADDPLAEPQGKGHGFYIENASGFVKVYDCIAINNFNNGCQFYGRSATSVGPDANGSVFANSGSPIASAPTQRNRNLIVGPEVQAVPYAIVQNCSFFQPMSVTGTNVFWGYGYGVNDGLFTNNIMVGGTVGLDMDLAPVGTFTNNKFSLTKSGAVNVGLYEHPYTFNGNTYYTTGAGDNKFGDSTDLENYTFAQWKVNTGLDANSSSVSGSMPDTIIVRPNAYETGRANIIVYVASGATSISLDLSTTGLPGNHFYTIQNAFNFHGSPVLEGLYNIASPNVALPLNSTPAMSVATPFGESYTPPTTLPQFAVFILVDGGPNLS